MALRNLVNKECGGSNPIVDLAQRMGSVEQNREWREQGVESSSQDGRVIRSQGNFQMESLLRSLSQPPVEEKRHQLAPQLVSSVGLQESAQVADWHSAFLKESNAPSASQLEPVGQTSQVSTISRQTPLADQRFQSSPIYGSLMSYQPPVMSMGTFWPQQGSNMPIHAAHSIQTSTKSAKDYLEDFHKAEEVRKQEKEKRESYDTSSFPQEARNFIDQIKNDPLIKNSEFSRFIEKIGAGDIQVTDDGQIIVNEKDSLSEKWAQEYSRPKSDAANTEMDSSTLLLPNAVEVDWNTSSEKTLPNISDLNYEFAKENPYLDSSNPFEEGLKKLEAGDIPSAVLHFEAAVQKDPSEDLYWQFLGTTQAQNEQDNQAIRALEECLKLQPKNLTASIGMAASLSNQSSVYLACQHLENWIRDNPKYSSLASKPIEKPKPEDYLVYMEEIRDLYMKAARLQPIPPDADVQCGLGILLNLTGEFSKAADCFKTALKIRPNDITLWNRLGASLANGDQPEVAIEAYKKALSISPGFVRCRANLGISCINLKKYKEAAIHFLTVLNMQRSGTGHDGRSSKKIISKSIWANLRLALILTNSRGLLRYVDTENLDALNKEFGIDPEHLPLKN